LTLTIRTLAVETQHSPASSPSIRVWLQLLRAPNLFTVPGDPIAGFLLATFGVLTSKVIFAVAGSVCLYAGGLLLNDFARPGRRSWGTTHATVAERRSECAPGVGGNSRPVLRGPRGADHRDWMARIRDRVRVAHGHRRIQLFDESKSRLLGP
jgi:hypothetical protein